jgi:hypothetical protein
MKGWAVAGRHIQGSRSANESLDALKGNFGYFVSSVPICETHDLYCPVGRPPVASFTMMRSAQVDVGGPLPAELAPDPGEYLGEGAITVPAHKGFDGT